jgi:DNA repair exonuclease SbcCD ATPase subunit
MILLALRIGGFGRLVDRRFDFAPGLNVVYGPNESGKSTLAGAIVATLYGAERKKEARRPWTGGPFTTNLTYRLANGREIEVQRDFDRDSKGLRMYDRAGNEISGSLGSHRVVPGEAHLGVPLEVFLNAACMKQQALALDEGKGAAPTATQLARALDGGPRDDAALGAIARLDDALRIHVGTEKARKNAPLRTLRALAEQQRVAAAQARDRLAALEDIRDRTEHAARDCERLATAIAEIDRRARSLRAGSIAQRLANLREFRSELADLGSAYAATADVADFPLGAERELDVAFSDWQAAQSAANAAQADAGADRLGTAELAELDARQRDAGTIDDSAFERLGAAYERVSAARTQRTQRPHGTEPTRQNLVAVVALIALCVAIGCAVAHSWTWMGSAAVVAFALFLGLLSRVRAVYQQTHSIAATREATERRIKDDEAAIAAILGPLGVPNFPELVSRRAALRDLLGRERSASRSAERARAAQAAADAAAGRFDALADSLGPQVSGDRAARRAAAARLAARRRERDGIAAHLHALELRRSTILGGDDEFALESELTELQDEGVDAACDVPGASRSLAIERAATFDKLQAARDTYARGRSEIDVRQAQVPDLAELDEQLALTQAEIARIEAFERAAVLARATIENHTREAHTAFARRLERDAGDVLRTITGGRYAELYVDPATLTIRLRIPETRAIADLDALSAGTRDQAYLVVRLAMARVFAEGLETPPLLLDDPFAYWDTARIERCLPVLEHAAVAAQAILFTSSSELAGAAVARGARRIDLPAPNQPTSDLPAPDLPAPHLPSSDQPAPNQPAPDQSVPNGSAPSIDAAGSARSTAMRI